MDKIKDEVLWYIERCQEILSAGGRKNKEKWIIEGELIAYSNILELMEDEHENEED